MNMRYGSSLNPKWMVDALWRKRKVIFCAISAVSIAWNAVVLAESLGIHKTLLNLLSRLPLQLRDVGELLVQRPVLYMLLNLIMLRMVVKSGMLGLRASKPVHEAGTDGRADKSVPIFDDHQHEAALAHEQAMKRRSSALFFSYTEPALNSHAGKPSKRTARQPKSQASLFTIEPLDFHTIEPRSITLLSATGQIVGTAQPDPMSPNIFAGHSSPVPAQSGLSPVSHKNPPSTQNGVSPVSHENCAPDHLMCADDYDLNRQEFNERVESFITKFKRNLTMQREDSFNRLLGLVGVGPKR